MADIQILMPMGGLGSRFTEAGYITPKPLIDVEGKPMFLKALESFNLLNNASYIFVIRKEQDDKYGLAKSILELLPEAKIAILDHNTSGAVESCLIAEELIDEKLPIIVADCDIYFESEEYFSKIQSVRTRGVPDAILLCFESNDPRYSYAELKDGVVASTAEKRVISNNAILGGYFFKNGSSFIKLAKEFVRNELPQDLKEYYLSHLLNMLITKNGLVEVAKIDKMHIFGTPEELKNYLSRAQ